MAVAITSLNYNAAGNRRRTIGTVTGDTSYPTGGYVVGPNAIGLFNVQAFHALPAKNATASTAIRFVTYDTSNNKMQFWTNNTTEAASGADVSTFAAQFEAVGF